MHYMRSLELASSDSMQNIRKILVVYALDDESLGGEVGAPRKEFTRNPPPSELIAFSV